MPTAINTPISVSLDDVTVVAPTDVGTPNPLDVTDVNIETKMGNHSVSVGTISAVDVTAPSAVTYSQVTTGDEVTNESLNRTAESLKSDINTKFGTFASDVSTAIGQLKNNSQTAIDGLKDSINTALLAMKDENGDQVDEVNAKIDAVLGEINTAFAEIRTKEGQQTLALTTAINNVAGELKGRDEDLLTAVNALDAKILALDELYATDTDIASKISTFNGFVETLKNADLDFVDAVDGVIDEVNAMERSKRKTVTISGSTGLYNWNNLAESFPEFLNANDYTIDVQVVDNAYASAKPINKTKDGFDIAVKTEGVHFRPQPKDCSVENVKVDVIIGFTKQNPLTFNVDTLKGSWMTDGNGTDVKVVGA